MAIHSSKTGRNRLGCLSIVWVGEGRRVDALYEILLLLLNSSFARLRLGSQGLKRVQYKTTAYSKRATDYLCRI